MTPHDQSPLSTGQAALAAGDFAGAGRIAQEMLSARPDDIEALILLAAVQDRLKAVQDCAATLERIMALAPARITVGQYGLLAKQIIHAGDTKKARAALARALEVHQDSLYLHIMHASLAGDQAKACDDLERVLANVAKGPLDIASVLNILTVTRAKLKRRAKGLPSDAISWEDACAWPDPEGLDRFRRVIMEQVTASGRGELLLDAAGIATCDRNWERADELMDVLRAKTRGSFADFTAFGSKFHAELDRFDEAAIAGLLPPVHHIRTAPPQSGETLLFASDPNYCEKFTLPFISAMDSLEIPVDIQVHVMGGDAARWRELAAELDKFAHVRASFSAEDSGPFARGNDNIRLYCHAIRFVRLFLQVARTQKPAWVFDVDVFVQDDPRALLGRLKEFDVAIRANPCLITPPARVAGNLVGIAPTPRGLEYARRVAAYILYWKERGTWAWGIDQVALYSAYAHLDRAGRAPKTYFQNSADASNDGDVDCVFYFPTGANKYIAAG